MCIEKKFNYRNCSSVNTSFLYRLNRPVHFKWQSIKWSTVHWGSVLFKCRFSSMYLTQSSKSPHVPHICKVSRTKQQSCSSSDVCRCLQALQESHWVNSQVCIQIYILTQFSKLHTFWSVCSYTNKNVRCHHVFYSLSFDLSSFNDLVFLCSNWRISSMIQSAGRKLDISPGLSELRVWTTSEWKFKTTSHTGKLKVLSHTLYLR